MRGRAGVGHHADGAIPRTPRLLDAPSIISRIARATLVAAIAWGAFAFGAVYPWAYWPLAIAAQAIAIAGLVAPAPAQWRRFQLSGLAGALLLIMVAVTIQLVPLPTALLTRVSPNAPDLIVQLEPAARAGLTSVHPLSIAPAKTTVGLVVVASLAFLLVGASRLLSITGVRGIAQAVTVVGVLLALTGIVQQPLFAGKIYGFWTLRMGGNPYGPFVNKNHFAGWMLMGLPVTLGLLCSGVALGRRGLKPGFRWTLLWLSSPDANRLLLLVGASAVMALSLILTMSRSGMAAAALAAIVTTGLSLKRHATRARKITGVAIVSAVTVVVVGWTGADAIARRFSDANWGEINNRKGPWMDAIGVIARYPLVGTGLNTYGVATLFYQRHDLSQHYAEAHNDYLQLAAEGGACLVIPAAVSAVIFAIVVRRRFRQEISTTTYWIRAGAVTGLLAIALQEVVEFSLQMPGNALLFVVLCAIALHRTPPRSTTRRATDQERRPSEGPAARSTAEALA